MMQRCKRCHSWAINEKMHGRIEGTDIDLCDVCYWRARAERADEAIDSAVAQAFEQCAQLLDAEHEKRKRSDNHAAYYANLIRSEAGGRS